MKKYIHYFTFMFLVLSLGILITSCDNNSTGTNPNPINGTWKSINNDRGYLHIDLPNLVEYTEPIVNPNTNYSDTLDCYVNDSYKLNKLSGDKYVATYTESGKTFTATIKVKNDKLILMGPKGNITKLERINVNFSQLVSQLKICTNL